MSTGIVFSGGGGKGAYQIGVWKALKEYGLDQSFDLAVGTSVGALNAAIFTQGDYEIAESVWCNITNDKIMTFQGKNDSSFFSQSGLKTIIQMYLSTNKIRSSKLECYACATCTDEVERSGDTSISDISNIPNISGMSKLPFLKGNSMEKVNTMIQNCMSGAKVYEKFFHLNRLNDEKMRDVLLASSALPVAFEPVVIDNHIYRDGGLIPRNNVPDQKAINLGCRKVLVISLNKGVTHEEKIQNTDVFYLHPSSDLGGMLDGTIDFSSSGAKYRICLGYNDTIEHMKKIKEFLKSFHTIFL